MADDDLKALKMRAAYSELFRSPKGEMVLANLMSKYWFFAPTVLDTYDPIVMASREGARGVILHILAQIQQSDTDAMNANAAIDLSRRADVESDAQPPEPSKSPIKEYFGANA